MLDGPLALTVVVLGLDDDNQLIDGTVLSASIRTKPGFDKIGFELWLRAVRPSSVFVARRTLADGDFEPDDEDFAFVELVANCARKHGVELRHVLLVGAKGAVTTRGWFPGLFRSPPGSISC